MQSSSAVQYAGGKHIDRSITLSPATTEKIFKTARALDFFNIECASKAKNIANTGDKTLSYAGSDGKGSCGYNYSDNKNVSMLTDMFLAIAFTMDEGRRLEFLHRYDRSGAGCGDELAGKRGAGWARAGVGYDRTDAGFDCR